MRYFAIFVNSLVHLVENSPFNAMNIVYGEEIGTKIPNSQVFLQPKFICSFPEEIFIVKKKLHTDVRK